MEISPKHFAGKGTWHLVLDTSSRVLRRSRSSLAEHFQRGGSPRFNEVSPDDFDVRVIRLGQARVLWVLRTFHSLFDGRISGESWSIMGWFRGRLISGSIRSSRSELRFSKDWLFGRLTSLRPLAGLYLYTWSGFESRHAGLH